MTDSRTGVLTHDARTAVSLADLGSGPATALLMIDVDHLKTVNDRFGHLAGDHVIGDVARAVVAAAGPSAIVGRFGGDKFVVLLGVAQAQQARDVAEAVRAEVTASAALPAHRTTVSIGGASCDGRTIDLGKMLWTADIALYAAKRAGRDRVRIDPIPAGRVSIN